MKKVLILFNLSILFILFLTVSTKTEAIQVIDSFGNYNFDYESLLDESYYQTVDTSNSTNLRNSLHDIIKNYTKQYPYNDSNHNNDVYSILDIIDQDVNTEGDYIYCILTGKVMPGRAGFGSQGSNVWNREHIWAKTWGFGTAESDLPFTDLNHLRAADSYANSAFHNDRQYNYVSSNQAKIPYYGQKYDSTYYEPRDAAKGDIARMIMYMDIRYEGDMTSDQGYELAIVENYNDYYDSSKKISAFNLKSLKDAGIIHSSATTDKTGLMSVLSVLLKWHEEDPVDDFERKRNDLVYQYQGNRNPFIDHPEYANTIYGANYHEGYHVSFYPNEGTFNYYDNNAYASGAKVKNPNINPTPEIGYQFAGWYLDEELTIKFDFSKDSITNNISFYAKYDFVGYSVEEALSLLKVQNCLKFNYEIIDEYLEPIETSSTIKNSSESKVSGFKKMDYVSSSADEVVDTYIDYDSSLFEVHYDCSTRAQGYLGSGAIRLYAYNQKGTALKVYVKDGLDVKINSYDLKIKFSDASKTSVPVLGTDYSVNLESNGQYIIVQNIINKSSGSVNNVDIMNLDINYVSTKEIASKKMQFSDMTLSYKVDLNEHLLEALNGYQIGLLVNDQYVVLELKDNAIYYDIKVSSFDEIYDIKPFILKDGKYQTDQLYVNSYSVRTLVDVYINDYKSLDEINQIYEILLRLL